MKFYLKMSSCFFVLFFGLLFAVDGVQVISEQVLSCTKSLLHGQYNATSAVDFFVGEEIVAVLDPVGPNYATYVNAFYPGNGVATVPDTSIDQQNLYESVCGKHFGSIYNNLAGVIGYNLSEIESYLSLPFGSLYIESFQTIGNANTFFNVESKPAYVSYTIPGATSYVNDTNPGPSIGYYISSNYNSSNFTYKNIYIFVDPIDLGRSLSYFNVHGPLPSVSQVAMINGTFSGGPGQTIFATFSVPAPQSGYDIYHAQTVDNFGVGVTQWILVAP